MFCFQHMQYSLKKILRGSNSQKKGEMCLQLIWADRILWEWGLLKILLDLKKK